MRVLKWLVILLVILQLPFCYQVFQTRQLSRYLSVAREPAAGLSSPFKDWRGGIHVHSASGGHSLSLYSDILEAARKSEYQYVFITEHPREQGRLQPIRDDQVLMIYGWENRSDQGLDLLTDETGGFRILSGWPDGRIPEGFDCVEIYNLHENGRSADNWFQRISFLYHQFTYPELFYFQLFELNPDRIRQWEAAIRSRHVTAVAGNDAHQNVGLLLQTGAGQRLFSIFVDLYEYSLSFVTTHLLAATDQTISTENVLRLLRQGSAYVAFESIGDPTGFSFHALDGGVPRPMGSEVRAGIDLVFQTPIEARFRLYRSGELFKELVGTRFVLEEAEPGIYRVEVYPLDPPLLLEGKPWILSNPIYVQ